MNRRSIPITTKRIGADGELEIRLFTMNDEQSGLFEACVIGLHEKTGWPMDQCATIAEKVIVNLLRGKVPKDASGKLLELQIAIPPLRSGDVQRLPRVGCPRGRVTGITLRNKDEQRTVLVELDEDQADFYNDAIREVRNRDKCTKDEAWIWVNNLIGRLLAGATFKEKPSEVIMMRAINLFPGLTKEGAAQLPTATEDDVLSYSFTMDRVRS